MPACTEGRGPRVRECRVAEHHGDHPSISQGGVLEEKVSTLLIGAVQVECHHRSGTDRRVRFIPLHLPRLGRKQMRKS